MIGEMDSFGKRKIGYTTVTTQETLLRAFQEREI